MEAISVESGKDKWLITVDANALDKDFVISLVEKLRLEYLAQKTNFDEEIESFGEEIKTDWWNKNKDRLLGDNK